MPAPINAFATNFELALVFSGVVLLWRYVFSPTARAQPRPPLLAPWDIPLSDFFLFLWIVICGGLVLPVVAQQTARALALSAQTKLILVNAGFQGGMLAGVGIYLLCFNRSRSRPSFGFTASILPGIATFLISLPLIVVVGLLWTGLLKLCGHANTSVRTSTSRSMSSFVCTSVTAHSDERPRVGKSTDRSLPP